MKRSIIKAIILFYIDAFVLNQGIIALITLVIVIPIMIIRALVAWKDKPLFKKRLAVCGIYLIMSILIFATNIMSNKIARNRAERIIAACQVYKDKNGQYPDKLSDLVPNFMDKIPVAKYTFMYSNFSYISSENSHRLFYVHMPPFGRPIYTFESKTWGYLD